LQRRARLHALAADRRRRAAQRARALPRARVAGRLLAHRLAAGREPAAGDPAPAAGVADALPVRVVGGTDHPRVVPHVRYVADLQVLRARTAPLRPVDAPGPTGRGPDHENRGRTPTLADHRRSVLPLGLRGRACEHATAWTRRDGS